MPTKEQRLEARITDAQKELFQRAAAIQGLSLTDFMITSLTERASQLVKDHDVMVLSQKDQKTFVDALLNPPPPNQKLRKAAQEHKKLLG
ncbi:DUF1778 domain-containing protein [bacterium]|nr:DUF1778 domain-containing protein [bacterium]